MGVKHFEIHEIEAEAARRVAALDGSAFGGTWTESPEALTADVGSALQSHLSFSATVEDAPVVAQDFQSGTVTVNAELRVIFLHRIRPGARRDDARLASQAAREVARAISGETWDSVDARVTRLYRPGAAVDAGFLPVEVRFQVLFDCFL